MPFDEALAMTLDGRITDAMSVIGIQRVALSGRRRARRAAAALPQGAPPIVDLKNSASRDS